MASISDFSENLIKSEESKTEWTGDDKETPKVSSGVSLSTGDAGQENKPLGISTPTATPTIATPAIATPPVGITTPAVNIGQPAQPSVEDILNNVLGNIGDSIGQHASLKMMVFGDPGSFKSSFLATAPHNLIADLEDGLISAKHSPHGIAEEVKPYRWRGFDDFGQLVSLLQDDPEALRWVKVFSIDTFSELHKRGLQEIMEREWRKRPSINKYDPQTEHHTENNERMLRMVRALRDTNRDLLISTHARTVEPKNKPAKTYADFSESLSNKIMAMMDVVGYCEKRTIDGKVVMVMKFAGDGTVHCKQRIGLPDELINPTYSDILEYWEASKNK